MKGQNTFDGLNLIAINEKELYDGLYARRCCDTTGYWREIAEFMVATSKRSDELLDIGCGHGDSTKLICSLGHKCTGVDISLIALTSKCELGHEYDKYIPDCNFTEAPIWDMPFADDQFDYTFSFDVMEHLVTETVVASIKEIYRITRTKTYHCISEIPSTVNKGIHKTVKPITWWRNCFDQANTKGIEAAVCTHDEFLAANLMLKLAKYKRSPSHTLRCYINPTQPKPCSGECRGASLH